MENNPEISKVKEELKIFMETEIQPLLTIIGTTNIITRGDSLGFLYVVQEQNNTRMIHIAFHFKKNEKGLSVSTKFLHSSYIVEENAEDSLDILLSALKKDVKKYIFTQMYGE